MAYWGNKLATMSDQNPCCELHFLPQVDETEDEDEPAHTKAELYFPPVEEFWPDMSKVNMRLPCARYELDFGQYYGVKLAYLYKDPRSPEYRYLLWMKKTGIPQQNPALGLAIEEFETLYFPEPKDYRFTYGTYITKTFPEVPDSYVRRLKNWAELDVHPGLEDALEYWERVAPRPPPEKKKQKDSSKNGTKRKPTR
ncbi:hypothetical protein CC86DRAFT_463280 [Ophiobolus disseminans]|uniref:Uncharacterized protein n=1 Tax=Ophiobolus disseminans TaxID=1469910 RepID=A0A6A7ADQ2_9PLEO|nr:hypothetical protein CC86DRAFT_463280 [Ophiobolus disseminans]